MEAASSGQEVISEVLIEYGANVNIEDKYRITVLAKCVERGHATILRILIDHGASLAANCSDGTPVGIGRSSEISKQ